MHTSIAICFIAFDGRLLILNVYLDQLSSHVGFTLIILISIIKSVYNKQQVQRRVAMISDFISRQPIQNFYIIQQLLGEGAFAQVRKALFRQDLGQYAVKIIDKKRISEEDLKVFLNECEILFKLEHPNIIEIYEIYDNPEFFYIVMEFMQGGQLCEQKNYHRCQDQNQITQVVKVVTDALDYCHLQRIVHRDIKPENILWSSSDEQAVLKIADFGFARMVGDSNMTTFCGTPLFFAPQILRGKSYDQSVDYWSLGVITYILLSGRPPFQTEDESALYDMIKHAKIQFPALQWKYISCSGKDFVLKLLEKNPKKRYGADKIREHPWINSDHTVDLHYKQRRQNLKSYQISRRLQKMRTMIQRTISDLQQSGDMEMIDQANQLM